MATPNPSIPRARRIIARAHHAALAEMRRDTIASDTNSGDRRDADDADEEREEREAERSASPGK